MSPLDGQRRSHVADGCLGAVVGTAVESIRLAGELRWLGRLTDGYVRLGLGHIHNGAAHAADEDHAALGLALHEVASDSGGKQPGAIDVDGIKLAHTVDGILGGIEVLGEAGRGYEVVNLAMLSNDVGNTGVDALLVGYIGVVSSDLGGS